MCACIYVLIHVIISATENYIKHIFSLKSMDYTWHRVTFMIRMQKYKVNNTDSCFSICLLRQKKWLWRTYWARICDVRRFWANYCDAMQKIVWTMWSGYRYAIDELHNCIFYVVKTWCHQYEKCKIVTGQRKIPHVPMLMATCTNKLSIIIKRKPDSPKSIQENTGVP